MAVEDRMSLEATIADAVREVVRQEIRNFVDEVRKATDDRAVSTSDAAQIMGVGVSVIRRMMRENQLPSFMVGRYRRIRVADLPSRKQ